MYGHILGRAAEFPEMKRIIEPPMHVDSILTQYPVRRLGRSLRHTSA